MTDHTGAPEVAGRVPKEQASERFLMAARRWLADHHETDGDGSYQWLPEIGGEDAVRYLAEFAAALAAMEK